MGESSKIDRSNRGFRAAEKPLILRASEGFSLLEALVAIVVAAILAVALTRLASNTRMNAGKIQELVDMMSVNGALLAQIVPKELGTTHGRVGKFAWHVAVAPLNFTAVARHIKNEAEPEGAKKPLALAAISDGLGLTKNQEPTETTKWSPVYVTVVVNSPSGRRYSVDTISIAPIPK
jgi:prepilin-type N-terminal cleavage/methylation domain-containing protein